MKNLLGIHPVDSRFSKLRRVYGTLKQRRNLWRKQYPELLFIEVTTKCNANCRYCARPQMVESCELEVMDLPRTTLETIVEDVVDNELHPAFLDFTGLGEPLLHPQLVDYIQYAKSKLDAEVKFNTNGILLDKVGGELVEVGLDELVISLNIFDRETYRRFNGVDKFDVVVENIKLFLREKGDKPPRVLIQLLKIDANKKGYRSFQEYWRSYLNCNDVLFFKTFENAGGKVDPSKYVSGRERMRRHPCLQLWRRLLFMVDGAAYPCCVAKMGGLNSEIYLGNVLEEGVAGVMGNGQLGWLRQMQRMSNYSLLPTCVKCDMWRHYIPPFFRVGGRWA